MNRRSFLKTIGISLGSLMLSESAGCRRRPARKPNIIFILADDLGWAELGCYGNNFNETPNLDKLAADGVRFTQAYAAAPVCSPYRAALLTGQYPARVGITDYLRPDDANHLSTDHVTIAEMLKRAGYKTGIIGKWHLTGYANHGAREFPPEAHGFDETIISENRGIDGGSYFYPYHFNREIEKRLPGKEHLLDRSNLEAVEFIERHKDEPFFLYHSRYAVHTRLHGKDELVAKYQSKPGAGEGPRADRNNPHLAAQLEVVDEGVGMIIRKLDELGLADDTIVIFTSDNGGQSGKSRSVTSNHPLREGKSTLYEGGIREPLIIRWPKIITPATVCTIPTINIDFYPTLLEAAGIKPYPSQHLDGVSIMPLLKDPSAAPKRDKLYWHYPLSKPHFLGGRSTGAIRAGDWKLIEFFDTGSVEMYNLADDIGEQRDLAGQMPEKCGQLQKLLADWREEVGAKTP